VLFVAIKRFIVFGILIEPYFIILLFYYQSQTKSKGINMKKITLAWYRANPEYVKEQNVIYDSKQPKHWYRPGDVNYWKTKLSAHKLRAKKLNRTAAWADEAKIEQIFRDCPSDKTIHHEFPLCADLVSGLHHESNLKYLTLAENCSLNNKFKPRYHHTFRATISLI
jgi:hypothetical protein